jgi:phage tail-like protein
MAELIIPSVLIDSILEDALQATQATILSGASETFALADGQNLSIAIDGGGIQVITFNSGNFGDISAATADEVVISINAGLTGATATNDNGSVRITSDTFGSSSSVHVSAGTATALAFSSVIQTGFTDNSGKLLANRIPEPNEPDVPRDTNIIVDIYNPNGSAPGVGLTTVTVAGTVAYTSSAFQAGFSGSTSNPDSATLRFTINPDTDFTSDQVVDVRVECTGPGAVDETYSFTIEDFAEPQVVTAEGRSKTTFRVTFDDAMTAVSVTGATDVLNPANYAVSMIDTIGVAVTPISVAAVSTTEYDVTVDTTMTFGADYRVTVSNVTDTSGNVIDGCNNTFDFPAFTPDCPDGRNFWLYGMLPLINRSEDATQDLAKFVAVFQEVTHCILCEIDRFADIIDLDFAPEGFLDAMLCDLGNPFDFVDLSENEKRRLLRVLVDIYKQKGTEVGIINAISFLLGVTVTLDVFNGLGFELAEATNPTLDGTSPPAGPGGELGVDAELGPGTQFELYSFEVNSPTVLTDEQRTRIEDIVNLMKPAHCHLVRIVEPSDTVVIDHLELGLSELNNNWSLHE